MSRPPLFDSTVALTLYNLMCREGELPLESLYLLALSKQHPQLQKDQALRCLDKLGELNLVERTGSGFKVMDPHRRPVIARLNTDTNEVLGTGEGGWTGWKVRGDVGVIPIEQALGFSRTDGGEA